MDDLALFGQVLREFTLINAIFGLSILLGVQVARRAPKNWHGTLAGTSLFVVLAVAWLAERF